MHIKIKAIGILKKYLKNKKETTIKVPKNAKISNVLKTLKIPSVEFMLITINGVYRHKDYKLNENDEIMLIPITAGG